MARIKRGAVGMPKRRKKTQEPASNGNTSAVPEQEAAEPPLVEPEVARQPVAPTTGLWSSCAAGKKQQRKDERRLAVRRKAFEKQEKKFQNQKKLLKRVLAANIRRMGPEGGPEWDDWKWLSLSYLTTGKLLDLEEVAHDYTKAQLEAQVARLEHHKSELKYRVACLQYEICDLRAVNCHKQS